MLKTKHLKNARIIGYYNNKLKNAFNDFNTKNYN